MDHGIYSLFGLEFNIEATTNKLICLQNNVWQNQNKEREIIRLLMWQISDSWVQQYNQNYMQKKLRPDEIREVLATIRSRIFCLSHRERHKIKCKEKHNPKNITSRKNDLGHSCSNVVTQRGAVFFRLHRPIDPSLILSK